ncbi:hypothetical protein EDC27_2759 [Desulfosoma caldarium]|uniref:Uncharacterized protein n=1 Tax=Desulfosoma caldarium TaxID=610254 RepID=A0A3N1USR1_9BACT|nr:hypothetical protein EDC27_2759 [Desulfosoma caldarium]
MRSWRTLKRIAKSSAFNVVFSKGSKRPVAKTFTNPWPAGKALHPSLGERSASMGPFVPPPCQHLCSAGLRPTSVGRMASGLGGAALVAAHDFRTTQTPSLRRSADPLDWGGRQARNYS